MAGCHSVLLALIVVPFSKESGKKLLSEVDFLAQHCGIHSYYIQTDFLKAFLLLISYFGFSTNSDAFLSSVSGEILNVLCLTSLTPLV